jgi:hypothetical protein
MHRVLTGERAPLVVSFVGQLPVNGRERSSMQFCESEEPPVPVGMLD